MILGARTYTIERVAAGSYVDGVWVDGEASTFSVTASWQPLTPREREALPEGTRTKATARLFCDAAQTPLRTATPITDLRCDVLQRDGRRYEVTSAADWTDHGQPTRHRVYVLSELGLDEEGRR